MTNIPTRGERNNNPTNLIRNQIVWLGMEDVKQTDDRFCVFSSAIFGMRAAFITMHHKIDTQPGLTIRELIAIWAPPGENNTRAYVASVCQRMGMHPDDTVEWTSAHFMTLLMIGVIRQENGRCIYSLYDINEAYTAAVAHCKGSQSCLPL